MHFYLAHLPEHNEAELAALNEFRGSLNNGFIPTLISNVTTTFQMIKDGSSALVLVQFLVLHFSEEWQTRLHQNLFWAVL